MEYQSGVTRRGLFYVFQERLLYECFELIDVVCGFWVQLCGEENGSYKSSGLEADLKILPKGICVGASFLALTP